MAPQRSKQQILEDKSRDEFSRQLPQHWVVRDVQKDYGIDVEVEVFEEPTEVFHGQATGATFKVQLKATSSLGRKAPTVAVRFNHYVYWNNLDVPVLIVLYVEDQGTFYAKWSVAHDPGPRKPNAKWTTIKFDQSEVLPKRVPSIVSDLQILRAVRMGRLPKPLPIQVESNLSGISHYSLMRELRTQIQEKSLADQLLIVPDNQEAAIKIVVTKTLIKVSMPLHAGSTSLHAIAAGKGITSDVQRIVANVVVLLGAHLAKLNRLHDALELVAAFPVCAALTAPEVAESIIAALHEERRPLLALEIAWPMINSDSLDLAEIGYFYLVAVLMDVDRLPDNAAILFVDLLHKYADDRLAAGSEESAGAVIFNISQALRGLKLYSPALDHLYKAQELKPSYEGSADFFRLVGGTAFRANRPSEAAAAYERAVKMGDSSSETVSELADSLFWAGRYADAAAVIAGKYGQELSDRLSVVNAAALREIVGTLELQQQSRRFPTVKEIERVESDPSLALSMLREIDALQSRLWFLLDPAIESWSLDRLLLHCRLEIDRGDLWAYATLVAYRQSRESLFPKIVEFAINDASDGYLDALLGLLEDRDDAERQAILEYAQSIAARFPRLRQPITLFGRDGLPVEEVSMP